MKLTKRKGFNFFRSYYDVYNELQTDKDKVAFIEALLDRQFLGIKPTNLKGLAKFAYISQVNSIDSQVKGYEYKTKDKLNKEELPPPTVGGRQGGKKIILTPCLQEEVQVQEKEEYIEYRKLKFADALKPFLSIYGKDMLNDFYEYWTEPNKSNTKFKRELQRTWSLERRLKTWSRNDNNFKPKNKNNGEITALANKLRGVD